MTEKSFKKIGQLISTMSGASHLNNRLSSLTKKSQKIVEITNSLNALLPHHLSGLAQVYDYYQGVLKVSVPSASIATQLRHNSVFVIKKLNNTMNFEPIISIQCRVSQVDQLDLEKNSCSNKASESKLKAAPISNTTKNKINALSKNIKNKQLAEALKKLGANSNKR